MLDDIKHNENEWECTKQYKNNEDIFTSKKICDGKTYYIKKIEEKDFDENKIKILNKLKDNEHSLQYHGYGKDNEGYIYVYMENIKNSISVKDLLEMNKPNKCRFERNLTFKISLKIIEELMNLHEKGIYHGDIRGDNILLIFNNNKFDKMVGVVFRNFSNGIFSDDNVKTHLAPEIQKGAQKNLESDIFSFGCLLIEMTAGNCKVKRDKRNGGLPIIPYSLPLYELKIIIKCCIVATPTARIRARNAFELLENQCFLLLSNFSFAISLNFFHQQSTDLAMLSFNGPLIPKGLNESGIVNLELPHFNRVLRQGSLPNTLICLILQRYNKEIAVGALPLNLESLRLDSFDQPATKGSIPGQVEKLRLPSLSHTIAEGFIPKRVIYLTLPSLDNLENCSAIPESVTNLELFRANTSSIKLDNMPPNVKTLILSSYNIPLGDAFKSKIPKVTNLILSSFNKEIVPGSLPSTIETLNLSSFNKSIFENSIPNGVTTLILHSFNQVLNPGVLPISLTFLELSMYDQVLGVEVIPNNVKTLKLPSLTKNIMENAIPNSVTFIRFSSFNHPITPGIFKNSVRDLKLTTYNKELVPFESLPYGIVKLTLNSFNQKLVGGSIPGSASTLILQFFNQQLTQESIPNSVTSLELSTFDQQLSGELPDYSILTLKLPKYKSNELTIHSIPFSVTRLEIPEYGKIIPLSSIPFGLKTIRLSSSVQLLPSSLPSSVTQLEWVDNKIPNFEDNCIPSSITSLSIISILENIESLNDLPKSISSLTIKTIPDETGQLFSKIVNIIKEINPLFPSLTINGVECFQHLLMDHKDSEWEDVNDIASSKFKTSDVKIMKKLNGKVNGRYVNCCIIKKVDEIRYVDLGTINKLKNNEYIMEYCGFSQVSKHYYIYKEFKNLVSIEELLKKQQFNRFAEKKILMLAIKILEALISVHDSGVVHRNIKCSNILLDNDCDVDRANLKLIGLGLSKKYNITTSGADNSKRVFGSETHLAQEIKLELEKSHCFNLKIFTCESDIYSYGCTLIEMAGGDLTKRDSSGQPIIPLILSIGLRNIIQRCCSQNKCIRPDSKNLLDMLKDLKINYDINGDPVVIPKIEKVSGVVSWERSKHKSECVTILKISNQHSNLNLIPTSITKLIFSNFSKRIQTIPATITNLDLGDSYDIIAHGLFFPNHSISTLKSSFKFTNKIFNIFNIPESVTSLHLTKYNFEITEETIPKTIVSLTLGLYGHIESLLNLPKSITKLKFATLDKDIENSYQSIITQLLLKSNITSLIINGQKRIIENKLLLDQMHPDKIPSPVFAKIDEQHLADDWILLENLGEGEFGSVVLARKINGVINNDIVEKCIVKKIKIKKFRFDEIDILHKLKGNKYVSNYYGCGIDSEFVYIYMESDENLIPISKLFKGNRFTNQELLDYAKEMALILKSIFICNVFHRDIKGDHFLVNKDTRKLCKIIDFGLSKLNHFARNQNSTAGTPTHMAPEVKLNLGKASYKSDIYSYGCTLIELAGGDLRNLDDNTARPIIPNTLSNKLRNIIQQCILPESIRLSIDQLLVLLYPDYEIPKEIEIVIDELKHGSLKDLIPKGTRSLSLPLFNDLIGEKSIPDSVVNLSFKEFNQLIDNDEIPDTVKYLDMGDKFDLRENGGNIPVSVLTLKCGFEFTKVLRQNDYPSSTTNLQLQNYNLLLNSNSISKDVISLTLGEYSQSVAKSLFLNLTKKSIINLKFGISPPETDMDELIKTVTKALPTVSSLIINGKERI